MSGEEGSPTDRELLSRLYELYSREIYLYLYSMCHDRGTAEDLMQESFLRAILSLPDEHTNMRAWLYRVARNLLTDQCRVQRNSLPLETAENLPAADEGPGAQFFRSERNRRLMELTAQLEPRRREVLSLQYFGGLRQKEIAALLHISCENVRVLSLRARRELKQKLEEDGYDFS